MASRPRHHDSGDDPPDDGGGPSRPHGPDGGHGSVAQAQAAALAGFRGGRPSTADDIELSRWEDHYDKLGDEPQAFNVATNDAAHPRAHTIDRHGPQIPLRRDPARQTIEGRIYGDTGWPTRQNGSFRWNDPSTMNRTINAYVRGNWERIRNDLAIDGWHVEVFDAGHAIGEGYVNRGMHGAGPIQPQYMVTSAVRIRIQVVPGTDPPQSFIVTAFPTGLG